jgi:hypothetical protein
MSQFGSQDETHSNPDVKALWESVDYWTLSTQSPPNEYEEGEGSTLLPSTADLSLDLAFFDFPHWTEVDTGRWSPTLLDFRNEGGQFSSLDELSIPDTLQTMANTGIV